METRCVRSRSCDKFFHTHFYHGEERGMVYKNAFIDERGAREDSLKFRNPDCKGGHFMRHFGTFFFRFSAF